MSRFAVLLYQNGGCDYTIGCGQRFVILPETIQSMEQAVQYVLEEEEEGTLQYHGKTQINSCNVFEISGSYEVDMNAVMADQRELLAARQKDERRRQFEQLRREFET